MQRYIVSAVSHIYVEKTDAVETPHEAGQEDYASCIVSATTLRAYVTHDMFGDPVEILVIPRTAVIEAGCPPHDA